MNNLYSDNGSTFQAASKKLPQLLDSKEFQNSPRHKGINWHFIPPYAPQQGGSWESLIKQFKIVLSSVLEKSRHKPNFNELVTYTGSAIRSVNQRPISALSDDPRDFSAITPASLLTPFFDPYSRLDNPMIETCSEGTIDLIWVCHRHFGRNGFPAICPCFTFVINGTRKLRI